LTKARLKLVEATAVALGRTLSLMSISAPERM
jgi:arginyl-tRNA synthetase